MRQDAQLSLLKTILGKFHLAFRTPKRTELDRIQADFGLRRFLGLEAEYEETIRRMLAEGEARKLYWLEDAFSCHYVLLLLPGEDERVLIAGPYLTEEVTRERLRSEGERQGIPPWHYRRMEDYYGNLPTLTDESVLLNIFTAFAEELWGSDFEIAEIRREWEERADFEFPEPTEREAERLLMDMELMERRYAFEQELMDIVARGQFHRAELMMGSFGQLSFEERIPDTLRNFKNYCVICNTLMRKAAQQGGVHPVYLDGLSSEYAHRIENTRRLEQMKTLIPDMARDYCRLVRKHAAENYSPIVRKTVLLIEADISRDLSLRAIAAVLNVSPGYLSAVFHKETGWTLTEFVNNKRMEQGERLLRSSTLQIQTVAQYCGIADMNYFSKLFKKRYGMTPREYRRSGQ